MSITIEAAPVATMYTCGKCGVNKPGKKTAAGTFGIPANWKVRDAQQLCQACWKTSFRLRAITLPVAEPVGITWGDLNKHLRESFTQSTMLANACVLTMMKAELIMPYGENKLPPKPSVYLYPLRAQMGLTINSSSAGSLMQAVQGKYNSQRFDLLVRRSISPPVYRYPYPYPVHNANWSLVERGGSWVVSVPLDGVRVELLLKSTGRHRQVDAMRLLIGGKAKKAELAIYESRKMVGRTVFVKMMMWLPNNVERRERKTVMTVRTDANRLLVATMEGREIPLNFNEDGLRRKIIGHAISLQRMNEDRKRNRRYGEDASAYGRDVAAKCDRQNRRLKDAVHQLSATLVKHAAASNVQSIVWDVADRGYCRFPWYALKEAVVYKCSEHGIAVCDINKDEEKEPCQTTKRSRRAAKPSETTC